MNPLATDTLSRVQRETGEALDPVRDFDLIRDLVDASESTLDEPTGPATNAALIPCYKIGNVTLWRLSYGLKMFFEREVYSVWADDPEFIELSFAWCMAHSREPDLVWEMQGDPKAIKKAVRKWGKTVNVPLDCLIAGMDQLQNSVKELYQNGGDGEKEDFGRYVAELSRQTGRTVEELVWRVPEEELAMLLTLSPGTGAGEGAPNPNDPKTRAIKKVRDAEQAIREVLTKRKEERNAA